MEVLHAVRAPPSVPWRASVDAQPAVAAVRRRWAHPRAEDRNRLAAAGLDWLTPREAAYADHLDELLAHRAGDGRWPPSQATLIGQTWRRIRRAWTVGRLEERRVARMAVVLGLTEYPTHRPDLGARQSMCRRRRQSENGIHWS